MDAFKGHPGNGVDTEEVPEKTRNVAQPLGFLPMAGGVAVVEGLLKESVHTRLTLLNRSSSVEA